MSRYATLGVYSSDVGKGIVFAETSTGYWGFSNSTSTGQRCDCSDNILRAALIPTVKGYYCNGWTSSGYTIDSSTDSLISFTSSKSSSVLGKIGGGSSSSGPSVSVVDEHGTHDGTPTGSSMHFKSSHVIGVKHLATDSGYVFKGWKVTKSSTSSSSGTFLSQGGTTSGTVTTFDASYDSQYAIVFQLASSNSYSVTIEAIYETLCTVTYNANGGSSTPSSQSVSSGTTITLASAITRSGYNFGGWSIDGEVYGAEASYTVNSSVTATAIWTQYVTFTINFSKNNDDVKGDAIPSVTVTQGNATVIPYPDGWSLDDHEFSCWSES